MRSILKFTGVLSVLCLFLVAGVTAQTRPARPGRPKPLNPDSISQKELKTFAKTSNEAQKIQQESATEVRAAVKKDGMTFSHFRQLVMASRNPNQKKPKMSKSDQKKMAKIQNDLMKIQSDANQKIIKKIKDNGMTVERYQRIIATLQTNNKLRQRFGKVKKEQMSQ